MKTAHLLNLRPRPFSPQISHPNPKRPLLVKEKRNIIIASENLQTKSVQIDEQHGKHTLEKVKKFADPRDFRRFTIDEAKVRGIKMGVVNKINIQQRPIHINEQIIEAARTKNALHYVHVLLQGKGHEYNPVALSQADKVSKRRVLTERRKAKPAGKNPVKKEVLLRDDKENGCKIRKKLFPLRNTLPVTRPLGEAVVRKGKSLPEGAATINKDKPVTTSDQMNGLRNGTAGAPTSAGSKEGKNAPAGK